MSDFTETPTGTLKFLLTFGATYSY